MTAGAGQPALARKLGTADAVLIGLGSMLGAGVFAAFGPAAGVVGSGLGLLIALGIAAVVAYCNATSSAQLAAQYPTSGGTYFYGREQLGEWWGFLAGWGFVIGKTASCAAMALTFAAYVTPGAWERPVAATAVVALAALNYRGITRTARVARVLVAVVLVAMVAVFAAILLGGEADAGRLLTGAAAGPYGVLQGAGLLFFAFAGYARIATLGEEVRDPRRTIPRAIQVALGATVVIYTAIALALLSVLGATGLAASDAPLGAAVEAGSWVGAAVGPIVGIGAAAAALGALLALIAGVGRTSLAMARAGDLPHWLAAVHPRHQVPHHAEVTLAVAVSLLVLTLDLRGAIGFSSFGVLIYYLIANLSALRQRSPHRRFPRVLQVVGAGGCVVLVATLPVSSIVAGVGVFAVGAAYRSWRLATAGRARR